jgi:hypothetical protein
MWPIVVIIRVMVFNATFNNISVISWWSVLLVNETRVAGENHYLPDATHWQTLSHNVVSSAPHQWAGFKLPTLVVIGTDCTSSCKSSYHMIMTTTTPIKMYNLPCLSNNLKEGTTWIRNSLKPCSCATGLSNKSVKKPISIYTWW